MKLEYLAGGSPECPLVRLYDFAESDAGQLLVAINALTSGSVDHIAVHLLPFVDAAGGCRLNFVCKSWDQGIVHCFGPNDFECGFTTATWKNVAGLVAPFSERATGCQWLAGIPGEAALLLSPSGQW